MYTTRRRGEFSISLLGTVVRISVQEVPRFWGEVMEHEVTIDLGDGNPHVVKIDEDESYSFDFNDMGTVGSSSFDRLFKLAYETFTLRNYQTVVEGGVNVFKGEDS